MDAWESGYDTIPICGTFTLHCFSSDCQLYCEIVVIRFCMLYAAEMLDDEMLVCLDICLVTVLVIVGYIAVVFYSVFGNEDPGG
jgi:hypothetical protein